MSVEFDALYFVKDPSMLKAFDFALGIFDSTIGDVETFDQLKEKPLKEIKRAVASALTSGIAYLANRGADEYLQEVGTVTWQAIKSGFVRGIVTDNSSTSLEGSMNPRVSFNQADSSDLITPIDFLLYAKKNPIGALSAVAFACSTIRDFMNGRGLIDKDMFLERATATKTHFLIDAMQKHPGVVLSETTQKMVTQYPHGIYSLPAIARYQGISAGQFVNAHLN